MLDENFQVVHLSSDVSHGSPYFHKVNSFICEDL